MYTELQELLRSFRREYSSRGMISPIGFSDLIAAIYTDTMRRFDERLGPENYREPYRDGTKKPNPAAVNCEADVAAEMWSYFPSHFFKFHQMLSERALPESAKDLPRSIFGCPRFTILDVGAGVGTAALATIDLLQEWQKFLLRSGNAPPLIEVTVLPVEANALKVPVLNRVLNDMAQRVCPYLVKVRLSPTVEGHYPDASCVNGIRTNLSEGGPHLFVTFSNILSWIGNWKPAPSSVGLLKRALEWLASRFIAPKVPDYLLQTVALLNDLRFDVKTVAFVETNDSAGRLSEAVGRAVEGLTAGLQDIVMSTADTGRVIFLNPRSCKWQEIGKRISNSILFHRGFCRAIDPSFRSQQLLHHAFSLETVRLAWAKVRHWEQSMYVTDVVATKLFEANLPWSLERFRQLAYAGLIQDLYTSYNIRYEFPKAPEKNRSMTSCSLEDQMLLVALTWVTQQVYERQFDRSGKVSYGYRLNERADEFLYRHWFQSYKRFLWTILQALRLPDRNYVQGDLARFFDSIPREILIARLLERIALSETTYRRMWGRHLALVCWNGTSDNRGLLQGHAVSGFLANVYLSAFDEEVCERRRFRNRYFRYVDDMVWICDQRHAADTLVLHLKASLTANYGLEFNPDKAMTGCKEDFNRRVFDPELTSLAERSHTVIRPVFHLGREAYSAYRKDKQEFCRRYAGFLGEVGVFVSPWHLIRKLRDQGTVRERVWRMFDQGQRLKLPEIARPAESKVLSAWVEDFQKQNRDWCVERERLADALLNFYEQAHRARESNEGKGLERFFLRRIRFAAFRLGVFFQPRARAVFGRLLATPWLVLPHITARALRFYRANDILREGLKSSIDIVRVKCAQEIGYLGDEAAKPRLWEIAERGGDVERLVATEALLRTGTYTGEERENLLRCLERESHPYVLKNLVLMLSHAGIAGWERVGQGAAVRCPHQVVVDSLAWALQHASDNVLFLPDVEPPYTAKTWYPDFELYPVYLDWSG